MTDSIDDMINAHHADEPDPATFKEGNKPLAKEVWKTFVESQVDLLQNSNAQIELNLRKLHDEVCGTDSSDPAGCMSVFRTAFALAFEAELRKRRILRDKNK